MKRTAFVLIALILTGGCLMAQSTFGVTGGNVKGASGSLTYTMGQFAIETTYGKVTNASRVAANLREGVQQTYTVEELRIDGVQPLDCNVNVYPNPTVDYVTVGLANDIPDLHYELYSIDGKLLQKGTIQQAEQNIEMRNYAAGTYVLRLAAGRASNSYRIVKNN